MILSDNESIISVGSYDENWQELISPEDVQISYDYDPMVLIKDNGNILILSTGFFGGNLIEYDSSGNLISPEDGWLCYDSFSNNIKVSTNENVINLYSEKYGQVMQTIYGEGEILYEESRVLGSDRIISGENHEGWQTDDKLVFCCRGRNNEYFINYLNEDGDILYNGQFVIDNPDFAGTNLYCSDDNGFYIVGHSENEEGLYDIYMLRIDTSSDPELIWGNSGLYLLTHPDLENFTYNCQLSDNLTLFYWYEENELMGQSSDGTDFLWESGGVVLDTWSVMGNPRDIEYIDGYLRFCVIDYPEIFEYVNRLDSDHNLIWEESVLLTTGIHSWLNYNYVSETELYSYWVVNVNNEWRLMKQIVTESGEKLCGDDGIIILETDNEVIREILADENNDIMGVVLGEEDEPEITYFTLEGEPLGMGTVNFPEINGREIEEIILKDGYVVFYSQSGYYLDSELQICVYDLEGNLVPEMPGLDYSVDSKWQNLIFAGEDAIYFTYNHQHQEEEFLWYPGGTGIDMVAQKLSLPNLATEEEEIYELDKMITAYPNPFNPEVTISFNLREKQYVELDIYNIKGQHVRGLTASEYSLGRHEVIWKGDNDQDSIVSSGVYYLKLQTGGNIYTEKVVLIK